MEPGKNILRSNGGEFFIQNFKNRIISSSLTVTPQHFTSFVSKISIKLSILNLLACPSWYMHNFIRTKKIGFLYEKLRFMNQFFRRTQQVHIHYVTLRNVQIYLHVANKLQFIFSLSRNSLSLKQLRYSCCTVVPHSFDSLGECLAFHLVNAIPAWSTPQPTIFVT